MIEFRAVQIVFSDSEDQMKYLETSINGRRFNRVQLFQKRDAAFPYLQKQNKNFSKML